VQVPRRRGDEVSPGAGSRSADRPEPNAEVVLPASAARAGSTLERRVDRDDVADFDLGRVGSDRDHLAPGLMTRYQWVVRHGQALCKEMVVGATDAAAAHPDNRLVMGRRRIGNGLDGDAPARLADDDCTHQRLWRRSYWRSPIDGITFTTVADAVATPGPRRGTRPGRRPRGRVGAKLELLMVELDAQSGAVGDA
jgi:hypothetical protein